MLPHPSREFVAATTPLPATGPPADLDLSLYAVTDAVMNERYGRSLAKAVRAAIIGGATAIQVCAGGGGGNLLRFRIQFYLWLSY